MVSQPLDRVHAGSYSCETTVSQLLGRTHSVNKSCETTVSRLSEQGELGNKASATNMTVLAEEPKSSGNHSARLTRYWSHRNHTIRELPTRIWTSPKAHDNRLSVVSCELKVPRETLPLDRQSRSRIYRALRRITPISTRDSATLESNLRKARSLVPVIVKPKAVVVAAIQDGDIGEDTEEEVAFGNLQREFSTNRRPKDFRRELYDGNIGDATEWYKAMPPMIGDQAIRGKEFDRAVRLLYTWRDLFVQGTEHVPATDLVVHKIPTWNSSRPVSINPQLYTLEEEKFQKKVLPELQKAGVVYPCESPWNARTKFPRKKDGTLRMVHNFIPINRATIRSNYPMKRIEPVLNKMSQTWLKCFFETDASNGYWAIPLWESHAYKTAFSTCKGQYCYGRMGQGLTGGPATYTRLKNIVTGDIPPPFPEPSLSDVSPGKVEFDNFVDDDSGGADTFESLFNFLHSHYFPREAWSYLTMNPKKSKFFTSTIGILGHTKTADGIRPSADKIAAIRNYPAPLDQPELERFLFLLPYLRRTIPGRADLAAQMRKAIVTETTIFKEGQRKRQLRTVIGFQWGPAQQEAFDRVKWEVCNNAVSGGNENLQYHLATDASKTGLGAVLFQIQDTPVGTNSSALTLEKESVIMYMSFILTDTETRYTTTEREVLALVRALEECRWLVLGSKYDIKAYTDHQAMLSIMSGNDAHHRIARWQYKLSEYPLDIVHVPGKELVVADGLSRIPHRNATNQIRRRVESSVETAMSAMVCTSQTIMSEIRVPSEMCLDNNVDEIEFSEDTRHHSLQPPPSDDIPQVAIRWCRNYQPPNWHHLSVKPIVLASVLAAQTIMSENTATSEVCLGSEAEGTEVASLLLAWKKWIDDDFYKDVVTYKLTGRVTTDPDQPSRKIHIQQQALRYVVIDEPEKLLCYRERSGELSACIKKSEIPKVLAELHGLHGHFSANITMKACIGKYYWPTRSHDIARYCRSCFACQSMGPLKPSRGILPIVHLQPLDMMAIDWMGPFRPVAASGARYICVGVDYMSRFCFAQPFKAANSANTLQFVETAIVRPFGWMRAVYLDNGSHFTGGIFPKTLDNKGVKRFHAPITHPSSVGLAERYVQMVLKELRAAIQQSPEDMLYWDTLVQTAVEAINTRVMRETGFSPAQILMGFNPKYTAEVVNAAAEVRCAILQDVMANDNDLASIPTTSLNYELRLATLDEMRNKFTEARFKKNRRILDKGDPRGQLPEVGDLVMLRRSALDNQHGRKLEPRNEGPYFVKKVAQHGQSAWLYSTHDDSLIGKYHLNDIWVFCPRDSDLMMPDEATWQVKEQIAREQRRKLKKRIEEGLDDVAPTLAPDAEQPPDRTPWVEFLLHPDSICEESDWAYWQAKSVNLQSLT